MSSENEKAPETKRTSDITGDDISQAMASEPEGERGDDAAEIDDVSADQESSAQSNVNKEELASKDKEHDSEEVPEIHAEAVPSTEVHVESVTTEPEAVAPVTAASDPIAPHAHSSGPEILSDSEAEKRIRRISRRSFIWAAGAVIAAMSGWEWLIHAEDNNGVVWPLRNTLLFNEKVARTVFKDKGLSPIFPKSWATEPLVTGDDGLSDDFDPSSWSLNIIGGKKIEDKLADDGSVLLTLDDIKALPKVDEVVEHHCVEGWSRVVHWSGARLSDFVAKYGPETMTEYVGLETPDGGYYVGLEREAAMHPQTLLCYEMNGAPLGSDHGEPLRLAIPTKYGIKNIKRIGTITFTNKRPADFWAEQGYDWYAGL